MRILHVIGWLDFADGGPPIVTTHLAAAQADLGHDVTVAYYSSPVADQRTDAQLKSLPHWEKVKVHRLPPCSRLERLTGRSAGRALAQLVASVDVVHLHNVWEGILIRAAAEARRMHKPYLVIINGMLHPWSLAQSRWKKRIALLLSHHRMLDHAAMIHVLNEDEKQAILPLGIRAPSIVIPNGVMLEEIEPLPPRGEFLGRRPELNGRRFVLFLARLHYKKGLDYSADAFAILAPRLADVDLVVAGPDGGERENFQRRIAAAGLSGRVHLVGPIYGREKFSALVDADCFVLPSRQEGFSVAALEAMAASTPVILSQECNFPEAAVAGEIVPLNAPAVAAALERVLTNPNRRALGQGGRALVEARYTWKHIAGLTISAYEQAIKSAR